MKLRKIALIALCSATCFLSCNKDDDNDIPAPVEDRDRDEQQVEDKADLLEYFATHYYNSSEFEALTNPTINDLKITKLVEGTTPPADGTLLEKLLEGDAPMLETKTVVFADTNYEYYILRLKNGTGNESPTFADNVVVVYEGFTLDDAVFDSAVNPTGFDLIGDGTNINPGTIEGWKLALPNFNVAEGFDENDDGTISFYNQGIGVMFMPSGLAYFSSSRTGIPAYSPIIFKFELLQMSQNDHDNDGVPSYLEDLNKDGILLSIDDNTDGDSLPDYLDNDDDGDGVLTINELERITYTVNTNLGEEEPVLDEKNEFEIERSDDAGVITIKTLKIVDSDNNGDGDYLDKDITTNYNK
ncbi:FKBP-type peptidyl-prolyl cis-trans isomerase [Flavivirga rizhaonensis]|uniref:peptidylprolyl isomerase n=1 Tax=Flavivirga rizhaonensis TaxID=2559571 RepID=A0A4S1DXS0_9FLAO|nr:hypothetical protein [Flavivirga rizhaonensis]TGV02960.1 hypothetical protein EM932_08195 [Flavivirga rizhaonensis]